MVILADDTWQAAPGQPLRRPCRRLSRRASRSCWLPPSDQSWLPPLAAPSPRSAPPLPDRPKALPAALHAPMSRYEAQVGTIIKLVLLASVNGDLPGQVIAQVRETSAGVQQNQMPAFCRGFTGSTSGNVPGAEVGQEFGETSVELFRRGTSIASTIRPGSAINEATGQTVGLGPSPCRSSRDPVGGSELPRGPMADWRRISRERRAESARKRGWYGKIKCCST
jgi:hypothetical protein